MNRMPLVKTSLVIKTNVRAGVNDWYKMQGM